jgi:hypothetical protein
MTVACFLGAAEDDSAKKLFIDGVIKSGINTENIKAREDFCPNSQIQCEK